MKNIIDKFKELKSIINYAINDKVKEITKNGTKVIWLNEPIRADGFGDFYNVVYINEDMTARLTNNPNTSDFYNFLDTQDLSYDNLYHLALFLENGLFVLS